MVSRSELATRLARDGASHAQAVHAVDAVLHEITAALVAGERVALTGFGTFEPVARPERTARNPRTGAAVRVAATTVARFHAGAGLRGALVARDAGPAPTGALPVYRTGAAAVTSSPVAAADDGSATPVVPAAEPGTTPATKVRTGSTKAARTADAESPKGSRAAKIGKKPKGGKKVSKKASKKASKKVSPVAAGSTKATGGSGKKSKAKR